MTKMADDLSTSLIDFSAPEVNVCNRPLIPAPTSCSLISIQCEAEKNSTGEWCLLEAEDHCIEDDNPFDIIHNLAVNQTSKITRNQPPLSSHAKKENEYGNNGWNVCVDEKDNVFETSPPDNFFLLPSSSSEDEQIDSVKEQHLRDGREKSNGIIVPHPDDWLSTFGQNSLLVRNKLDEAAALSFACEHKENYSTLVNVDQHSNHVLYVNEEADKIGTEIEKKKKKEFLDDENSCSESVYECASRKLNATFADLRSAIAAAAAAAVVSPPDVHLPLPLATSTPTRQPLQQKISVEKMMTVNYKKCDGGSGGDGDLLQPQSSPDSTSNSSHLRLRLHSHSTASAVTTPSPKTNSSLQVGKKVGRQSELKRSCRMTVIKNTDEEQITSSNDRNKSSIRMSRTKGKNSITSSDAGQMTRKVVDRNSFSTKTDPKASLVKSKLSKSLKENTTRQRSTLTVQRRK